MQVRFTNINWDTTETSEELTSVAPPDLPKEVTLDVPDDTVLDEEGADVLSNKYGFCVNSFDHEIV